MYITDVEARYIVEKGWAENRIHSHELCSNNVEIWAKKHSNTRKLFQKNVKPEATRFWIALKLIRIHSYSRTSPALRFENNSDKPTTRQVLSLCYGNCQQILKNYKRYVLLTLGRKTEKSRQHVKVEIPPSRASRETQSPYPLDRGVVERRGDNEISRHMTLPLAFHVNIIIEVHFRLNSQFITSRIFTWKSVRISARMFRILPEKSRRLKDNKNSTVTKNERKFHDVINMWIWHWKKKKFFTVTIPIKEPKNMFYLQHIFNIILSHWYYY